MGCLCSTLPINRFGKLSVRAKWKSAISNVFTLFQWSKMMLSYEAGCPISCLEDVLRPSVRPPVRHEKHIHADKVRPLSSESSTLLTFICREKDSNLVHWEVHTWLSRKLWQISGNRCHCQLIESRRIYPFDCYIYIWYRPMLKSDGHVHFDCEDKAKTDRVNITVVLEYEVAYAFSIGVCRFDLVQFQSWRSRYCTFQLRIYLKWRQLDRAGIISAIK